MNRTPRFSYFFILLIDFILPIPLFVLMYFLWMNETGDPWFSAYTLLLGLSFGYIIPGIGTNLLNLWKFCGPFKLGKYLIHHGFMYAPYFSLVLFVCFRIGEPGDLVGSIAFITVFALVQGFLSTMHDLHGLRCGFIILNSKLSRQGLSHEEVILDYAPIGFSLFGGTYALSCLLAREIFAQAETPGFLLFFALISLGVFLMGISSVPYLIREKESIHIR